KLEVLEVNGPASSRARITSGKPEDVHAGDLFQITRLAVPAEAKLTVFLPGVMSGDDWKQIRDQLGKLRGTEKDEWSLVEDPALELPSNLVYWTSAGWTITLPQGGSQNLGGALTADSISKIVSSGSKVYVSVPPSRPLVDALKQGSAISSGAIEFSVSLA